MDHMDQKTKQEQMERMNKGKGFIAALDQSGGSTPKALKLYGITEDQYQGEDEMYRLVHEMRTRIMTSPAFHSNWVLAAILFENTMDRRVREQYSADYLWETKGVLPILKVDRGLAEEAKGVQLMKPIPGLSELLKRANERHIFGTKMRSVIKKANPEGIKEVVDQQFELGAAIAAAGLVPIIEPEVDIFSTDKAESEKLLKKELQKHLADLSEDVKVIFKLSLPSEDDFYKELMQDPHVVRVVALSGGYSREDADQILARNHGMIASFSRALTQGLNYHQTEKEFDDMLEQAIKAIYTASIT